MNEQLGAFLTLVIQAVVTAALPVLLAFAVAWINKKVGQAKAKLTADQFYLVETGIRIFVEAAEQSGLWSAALATGKQKKLWVLEQATAWCAQHGVPIDLPAIDAQIEAIVRDMNWDETELAIRAGDVLEVASTPDEQAAELTEAYEAGAVSVGG